MTTDVDSGRGLQVLYVCVFVCVNIYLSIVQPRQSRSNNVCVYVRAFEVFGRGDQEIQKPGSQHSEHACQRIDQSGRDLGSSSV